MSLILIDRDAGDAIAAMRMIGTSREFARFTGRRMLASYDPPLPTMAEWIAASLDWQASTDIETWVKDRASVTHRIG